MEEDEFCLIIIWSSAFDRETCSLLAHNGIPIESIEGTFVLDQTYISEFGVLSYSWDAMIWFWEAPVVKLLLLGFLLKR